MNVFVNLDLFSVVSAANSTTAAAALSVKRGDVLTFRVYLYQGGSQVTLPSSPTLSFGVRQPGSTTLLVLTNSWTLQTSDNGYLGTVTFNTSAMGAALSGQDEVDCLGEFYLVTSDGQTIHTLDWPLRVYQDAVTSDDPPAAFSTLYPDPSVIEVTSHKGAASGYAGLDTSGKVPTGQLPNIPESQVTNLTSDLAGKLPTSTTLDQIAAPGANVSLNSHLLTNLLNPVNPQDAATRNYVDTGLAAVGAYPYVSAFTAPAIASTVNVTVSDATGMALNISLLIGNGAGVYLITAISGATLTLKNLGGSINAAAGTAIAAGAVALIVNAGIAKLKFSSGNPGNLTSGTALVVTFDTIVVDTIGASGADKSKLTAPVAGTYIIGGCFSFASGSTASWLGAFLNKNSTSLGGARVAYQIQQPIPSSAGVETIINVFGVASLAAGDWVTLIALANGSSASYYNTFPDSNIVLWMVRTS